MYKFKLGDLLIRVAFNDSDNINDEIMRIIVDYNEFGYIIYYVDGGNCAFLSKEFIEKNYRKLYYDK